MSIVAPNGQVRLLKDIPLDDGYENTLWFATEQEQRVYFLNKTPVHVMYNATRVRNGVIAVDIDEDTIRNCNYLMFQNEAFSDKWFYAFINGTEYVNNNMTYVSYNIDPIQTYLFDIDFLECFIERETTSSDGMFEHLLPEDFRISDYVNSDLVTQEKDFSRLCAIVFTSVDSFDEEGNPVAADIQAYNGMLNGSQSKIFFVQDNEGRWEPMTGDTEMVQLNNYIKYMVANNGTDSIIGIILIPTDIVNYSQVGREKEYAKDDIYMRFENFNTNSEIDGYTPRNNKLYNSPFCVVEFGTSDGQKENLCPEYLPSSQCELKIFSNVSTSPSMLIVPVQYAGDNYSWDKAISFNGFPQVSCAIDGYKAWVASGSEQTLWLNTFNNVVNDAWNIGEGAANIVEAQSKFKGASQFGTSKQRNEAIEQGTKGVFQTGRGITDLTFDVAKAVNASSIAKRLPPTQKGSVKSTPLTTNKRIEVYVRWKTINADVAKSIDQYMTMYGYKVNTVKKPNLHNRNRFTFVKTRGCRLTGGAPNDDIITIETMFDKGIRFWADHTNVGNYSLANNPL